MLRVKINRIPWRSLLISFCLLVLGILLLQWNNVPAQQAVNDVELPLDYDQYQEWIIKWEPGYELQEDDSFQILQKDQKRHMALIKLHQDIDIREWYIHWIEKEQIIYLEPDYTLKIKAITQPNDPNVDKQAYLKAIHAYEAWDIEHSNKNITIAILDTGVDLEHPDLKENLVPGFNLIKPSEDPQDDHGHGTALAGVVAGIGNNEKGITGVMWSTNIMPVKVLPKAGEGSPFVVSKGIYQAVDQGASIILLSLGTPVHSQTLKDAVDYAEKNDVLMIAAVGNEAATVNYPAAYPTVFAVGTITEDELPASYSNIGPQINVVAPGQVYTTSLNGEYISKKGTSMSAAQVAGVAGLILKKYPNMKPADVRNHMMYTADDVLEPNWDKQTGHGRINMNQALIKPPVADIYESNEYISEVAPFPMETMVKAEVSGDQDTDWYVIETSYPGYLTLNVSLLTPSTEQQGTNQGSINLYFYHGKTSSQPLLYEIDDQTEMTISVPTGVSYIQVVPHHKNNEGNPIPYQMTNQFVIYKDKQQPNNTMETAFQLQGDGKPIVGTFHEDLQKDWYAIDIPKEGELELNVSVDNMRMDPVIEMITPDGKTQVIDSGNIHNGQFEWMIEKVTAGRYYINLHNYYEYRVNGEYFLEVTYRPYFEDPYEVNNHYQKAKRLLFLEVVEANIHEEKDVDWYRLDVKQERFVKVNLYDLHQQYGVHLLLLDEERNVLEESVQKEGIENISVSSTLKKGTYYVLVKSERSFKYASYHLQAQQKEVVEVYNDVKGHWAEKEITTLIQEGYFRETEDQIFNPSQPMTRAAVAEVFQNIYHFSEDSTGADYEDVQQEFWAYESIQRVTGAGIVQGYTDGTFRPTKSITRAEAAVILNRLLKLNEMNSVISYTDVTSNHWAYEHIVRVTNAGLLEGYPDGSFQPEKEMSRSEFAMLIFRLLNK